MPPVKHVFMVVLSDQGYDADVRPHPNDPYLAKTLVAKGELVQNYYAVAGSPLANEIALVSGQGPNPDTAADCPKYTDFIASGVGRPRAGARQRVRVSDDRHDPSPTS